MSTQCLPSIYSSIKEASNFLKTTSFEVVKFYHYNNALLQQISLLSLTTCVLASKIFSSIPKIIPRASLSLLNYVGIIYLDSQVMHVCKSIRDASIAIKEKDYTGLFTLSLKIYVKATDVLLTSASFVFSLLALGGVPQVGLIAKVVMRPISIIGWLLSSLNSTVDFYQNKDLLRRFKNLKSETKEDYQNFISLLVCKVLRIIEPEGAKKLEPISLNVSVDVDKKISNFAMLTVRQLEESSLREFSADLLAQLEKDPHFSMSWEKNLRYFKGMQTRIKEKNQQMTLGTGLSILGFIGLSVGRVFPDSLADWGMRWGISSLYTAKMVWKKIKLLRLAKDIS